jgi:hypothetical protein
VQLSTSLVIGGIIGSARLHLDRFFSLRFDLASPDSRKNTREKKKSFTSFSLEPDSTVIADLSFSPYASS